MKIPLRTDDGKIVWQHESYPNKLVRAVTFDHVPDPFYLWGNPKPSVLMIPITDDGNVIWTRQWRPGVINQDPDQNWVWELAGGHARPGQGDVPAAMEELMQETGHALGPDVIDLGTIWIDAPSNSAAVRVFIAFGCQKVGESQPEKSEVIERVISPVSDWLRECFAGDPAHRDSKTIAAAGLALPHLIGMGLVGVDTFLDFGAATELEEV